MGRSLQMGTEVDFRQRSQLQGQIRPVAHRCCLEPWGQMRLKRCPSFFIPWSLGSKQRKTYWHQGLHPSLTGPHPLPQTPRGLVSCHSCHSLAARCILWPQCEEGRALGWESGPGILGLVTHITWEGSNRVVSEDPPSCHVICLYVKWSEEYKRNSYTPPTFKNFITRTSQSERDTVQSIVEYFPGAGWERR